MQMFEERVGKTLVQSTLHWDLLRCGKADGGENVYTVQKEKKKGLVGQFYKVQGSRKC